MWSRSVWRLIRHYRRSAGKEAVREMSTMIPFYKGIWQEAANWVNADMTELGKGVWSIGLGNNRTVIDNFKVQIDDPVVLGIGGDKALCHRLLMQQGLPVPEHQVFDMSHLEKARQFMEKHEGSLFVIKPSRGTSGAKGISTHVRSFRECRFSSALASLYGRDIIIERFIPGESYRLLILDGKMILASRRRGLRIAGDGRSTIRALIEGENERRRHNGTPGIRPDRDFHITLRAQGLTGDSVPEAGVEVLVKGCDLSMEKGSEVPTRFTESVTGLMCNDLERVAVQAARIIGSRFAGVDIITLDPSIPLSQSKGVINEINTTPGLHHHYHLINQENPPPAVYVLKHLLDNSNAH